MRYHLPAAVSSPGRFHYAVALLPCRVGVGQLQHHAGGEGLPGSATIRAASSWAAAEAGPAMEAAIFWDAVRAALA
ncbi:hypothetical protein ACFC8N_25385 [Streptomyces sp. NPDC055966]|uniref:hypothetical protein n=1 Tax=Streptomyces sp. NPDC055966 TaxID=3345669 RepID=UPI0035D6F837